MIEKEARNNPMLSPEGIRRAKGEVLTPLSYTLTLVEPIPEDLRAEDGQVMNSWIRYWYHRDQEEKKMLRGHLETSFNHLLDIRAVIGR